MHEWIHGTIEQALDIYNTLIKTDNNGIDINKRSEYFLDAKRSELLEMVKVVIPNKYFRISALADEKQVINELARIQLELDLYAETHKEELDRIKSKIKVLKEHDITSINKYEMLDEVEMLKKNI